MLQGAYNDWKHQTIKRDLLKVDLLLPLRGSNLVQTSWNPLAPFVFSVVSMLERNCNRNGLKKEERVNAIITISTIVKYGYKSYSIFVEWHNVEFWFAVEYLQTCVPMQYFSSTDSCVANSVDESEVVLFQHEIWCQINSSGQNILRRDDATLEQ